VYNIKQ